jgi:hypothetical protein
MAEEIFTDRRRQRRLARTIPQATNEPEWEGATTPQLPFWFSHRDESVEHPVLGTELRW